MLSVLCKKNDITVKVVQQHLCVYINTNPSLLSALIMCEEIKKEKMKNEEDEDRIMDLRGRQTEWWEKELMS